MDCETNSLGDNELSLECVIVWRYMSIPWAIHGIGSWRPTFGRWGCYLAGEALADGQGFQACCER